jgi:hypothetical protein
MLFDKTPDEVLSEDSEAKARRLKEEEEARARWEQEIEGGRRRRVEQREVAKRFKEMVQDRTPTGRAKAAIEAGSTLFQLVLPLSPRLAAAADADADHNPTLNAIEAIGWRLAHASYVDDTAPQADGTADTAGASGGPFAVYIFKRSI